MKAVCIHSYGSPEVLRYEDVPRPSIADDEVLIQVQAVGINPLDWKARRGDMQSLLKLPMILGFDVAGTIAEVGATVTNFKIGDSVYAM